MGWEPRSTYVMGFHYHPYFFLFPVSDSQNDLQDLTLSTVSLVVLESVDRERAAGRGDNYIQFT